MTAVLLATLLAAALAPPQPPRATNLLNRVLAAGELRVCIWPEYYGITYRNPKTGQLRGIDIDVATALGQELEVRVRYLDSTFPQLAGNLLGGRCDIAMHAIGVTPARSAALAFTRPYLRSDIYAVASNNSSAVRRWSDLDLDSRVIAVQAGTVMEAVMRRSLRHASLVVVAPPQTREAEVESGRADAFMTDYPYSKRMLDMTGWARVLAPPQAFHQTDYAYALAPGDNSLLARVDRFMERLEADGKLARYAARHGLSTILLPAGGRRPPLQAD